MVFENSIQIFKHANEQCHVLTMQDCVCLFSVTEDVIVNDLLSTLWLLGWLSDYHTTLITLGT